MPRLTDPTPLCAFKNISPGEWAQIGIVIVGFEWPSFYLRYWYLEHQMDCDGTYEDELPTRAGARFRMNEVKILYNMRKHILKQLVKIEKINQGLDMFGKILADDYSNHCRSGEKTIGKGKKYILTLVCIRLVIIFRISH